MNWKINSQELFKESMFIETFFLKLGSYFKSNTYHDCLEFLSYFSYKAKRLACIAA